MKISKKEIKEILVTTEDGELVASITDEGVIGKAGFKVNLVIFDIKERMDATMEEISKHEEKLLSQEIAKRLSQKGVSCEQAIRILSNAACEIQKIPLSEVNRASVIDF